VWARLASAVMRWAIHAAAGGVRFTAVAVVGRGVAGVVMTGS
jgi:hypothetical protein